MQTIPPRYVVTSLDLKLAELHVDGLATDWYHRACGILRGGDGGEHGLLLHKLIRQRLRRARPLVVLDVGTARGFSAITMANALSDASTGTIYTIDVVDHHQARNWHVDKQQPAEPLAGMRLSRADIWRRWYARETDLVSPITNRSWDVLANWTHGPIDVAFLDGDHTRTAVSKELALLSSLMTRNGVIVLDDYHVGAHVIRIRSRRVNRLVATIGACLSGPWPSAGRRLRLGTDNEFVLVKQKFSGIKTAVHDFLVDQDGHWALEVVRMPARGDYAEDDYGLAVLTRTDG